MSFSYDISLTTDLDKVRWLTGDTDGSSIIYQDEELNGALGMEPNVYYCAATAIRARVPQYVTKAIRYQIGSTGGRAALEIDRTKIVDNFMKLADHYIAASLASIVETFDRAAFDIDVYGRDMSEYQGVEVGPGYAWPYGFNPFA